MNNTALVPIQAEKTIVPSIITTEDAVLSQNNVEDTKQEILMKIKAPVFILYCEYLGFQSKLLDWAERACKGETIPDEVTRFMEVEANLLCNAAIKHYGIEMVQQYYVDYYPLILEEYEKGLTKITSLVY